MKKSFVIGVFIFLLLATPLVSFAKTNEDDATEETTEATITPSKKPFGVLRTAAISNLKDIVKTKREEAMTERKSEREEFKAKLEKLIDSKKKNIVNRIDTRITNANQKHTDRMAENLEKLSLVLDRISSKAATLKSEGKDTTTLDTAIDDANTKISAAQTAVTNQANKDYVLTITDESTLGQTISPVVTEFRNDITTTHKAIMDAKQAVVKAAAELKKLVGKI